MKKIISILLVIIWMTLIFTMSSFNSNDSSNQSSFIVTIISNIININNLEILSIIIRKLAHFTEYLILGILMHNLTNIYNKNMHISMIICILYAISDEIHQLFVPGRSFQIIDIGIDCFGSIIGIYIFYLINKHIKKE